MGECMKWEEIIKLYPDKWIALQDTVMDGPNVISGYICAVLTDEQICDYEDEHMGEPVIFRRTTEGEWNGTISTNFVIEIA